MDTPTPTNTTPTQPGTIPVYVSAFTNTIVHDLYPDQTIVLQTTGPILIVLKNVDGVLHVTLSNPHVSQ